MPPLRLHAPGLASPVTFDLAAGHAALIGRKPLVAALDPACVPVAANEILTVTVDSALVSENHLLAWNDGSTVHLLDLRSTNGTRWRLPSRREVSAPAANALDIELGAVTSTTQGSPAPADWTNATEFRESVAREVSVWLTAQGLPANARVVPLAPETAAPRDCVALGDGWALRVEDTRDTDGTRTEHPAMGRALEKVWAYVRAQRGEFEVERDSQHDDLVLESPRMRAIHRMIFKAARQGLRGILQGESGVGKSRLAECFHVHSERRGGPFRHLNLAEQSSDRTFFQVKLFGARKGAATGIDRDRLGVVHAAHGGTLFLDEIGLLPLEVQGLLLTFLDGKGEFHRFGGEHEKDPERADVRIVVGTNTDLREAVRRGTFREDLWWRLAGVVVEIPPLRERREDVRAWFQNERLDLGLGPRSLFESVSPDARAYLLESHTWPGNLRELRSFLERLPIFVEGPVATLDECQRALRMGSLPDMRPTPTAPPPPLSQPPTAPQEDDWADVMAAARALFPRWLAAHPERQREGCEIDLKVFLDEIVKPLCVARALGVERWDELPKRPVPSYQVLAERIGYGDGKSVQDQLRLYLALKRTR